MSSSSAPAWLRQFWSAPSSQEVPPAASRQPLRAAASAALEALEARRLLAADYGLDVSASPSGAFNEGSDLTLSLSASGPDASEITGWVVDWGDAADDSDQVSYGIEGGIDQVRSHTYLNEGSFPVEVWAQVGTTLVPAGTSSTGPTPTQGGPAISKVLTQHASNSSFGPTMRLGDGLITVGTVELDSGGADLAIARFLEDGSPDPNFGNAGVVRMPVIGGAYPSAFDVAVSPDGGRFAVVGAANENMFLALFNADGTPVDLDANSPGANPFISKFSNDFASIQANAAAYGADGIYIAGRADLSAGSADFLAARFTLDGGHDTGWGTDGYATADMASSYDDASDLAILSDGSIALAGSMVTTLGHMKLGVAVIAADGDSSIALDINQPGQALDVFTVAAMTTDTSGRLLVAGSTTDLNGAVPDFFVARLTAGASIQLDNSFDGDGIASVDLSNGGMDIASSIAVDPLLGGILVGGRTEATASHSLGVARFNSDGSIDTSFDQDGVLKQDLGVEASVNYIEPRLDGSLLIAGNAQGDASTPNGFAIATYAPGPSTGGAGEPIVATVLNVAPAVTVSASSAPAVRGLEAVTFSGGFTDPGLDTWTARVDFGDGTSIEALPLAPDKSFSFSHTFTSTNATVTTATVTITDGLDAGSAAASATVVAGALRVDPYDTLKTMLLVGGTAGHDQISVSTTTGGLLLHDLEGVSGPFNPTGRITVLSGAGNDTIHLGAATVFTEAFGGAGDDIITAGSGGSLLAGEQGNDSLTGGAGRDIAIGGTGGDQIVANGDEDILIAGYSRFGGVQDSAIALNAISREWARTDLTVDERVDHLLGGSGGLNGTFFLKTTSNAQTLFDDSDMEALSVDTLTSNAGSDWIFFNFQQSGIYDTLVDRSAEDIRRDVDLT